MLLWWLSKSCIASEARWVGREVCNLVQVANSLRCDRVTDTGLDKALRENARFAATACGMFFCPSPIHDEGPNFLSFIDTEHGPLPLPLLQLSLFSREHLDHLHLALENKSDHELLFQVYRELQYLHCEGNQTTAERQHCPRTLPQGGGIN